MIIRPVIAEPALDLQEVIDADRPPLAFSIRQQVDKEPPLVHDDRAQACPAEVDPRAVGIDKGEQLIAVVHTRDVSGVYAALSTANTPHEIRAQSRHIRRMRKTETDQADDDGLPPGHPNIALLAFIRDRLAAVGLSERKACLNAGLKVDAVRQIKRGHRPHIDKLQALAPVLKVTVADLLGALGPDMAGDITASAPALAAPISLQPIPVLGEVQAGHWNSAYEWPEEDRYFVAAPPLPRYPNLSRFGLVVIGASMNRVYPEGTIAIVARYEDMARTPQPGDRVVCLRRATDTNDFEATIKEYALGLDGQHLLWPRSTDPAFQAPIILPGPPSAGEWMHEVGEADILIQAMVVQTLRAEPNL